MVNFTYTLKKTGLSALFFSFSLFCFAQQAATSGTPRPLAPVKTPVSLRPDIKVEKVMDIGKLGVRLLKNPKTAEVWYSTFDGNVFRISDFDTPKAAEHQVFTAGDHGITRLQGAAFLNNTLFLCGNISANEGKGTKGRMVKYG